MLCNSELAPADADAAVTEIAHIVNTAGRVGYVGDPDPDLVNRCFHCASAISGVDLAAEVRRTYLDGFVDLAAAQAPRAWGGAAVEEAGAFINHGAIPRPAAVPDFRTAIPPTGPGARSTQRRGS